MSVAYIDLARVHAPLLMIVSISLRPGNFAGGQHFHGAAVDVVGFVTVHQFVNGRRIGGAWVALAAGL